VRDDVEQRDLEKAINTILSADGLATKVWKTSIVSLK
jgi:hypothetical protein